ncbi:MAG: ABC transporter ATP-binding protein [Lachnospiraceae bacterium]|nr:ABC transporter ATP-binding protein [Lachnospiraceae bacterium]
MKKTGDKSYSVISNIGYAYRALFRKKPIMIPAVVGICLVYLGGDVVRTLTLPVIVASITRVGTMFHFLITLGILLALFVGLNVISNILSEWSRYYYENIQNREFLTDLVRKSLTADYVNVESPAQQRLLMRASHAVNVYREGVIQFYLNIPLIVSAVTGIIAYALTITFIDYRVLLLILLMTLVSGVLDFNARRHKAKVMDDQYRVWGRFYYLQSQATSILNGKDIRIYNMAEWFRSGFDKLIDKNCRISTGKSERRYAATASEHIFSAIRDIMAYSVLTAKVLSGDFSIAEFTLGLGVVSGLSGWLNTIRFHVDHLLEGNRMMVEYRKMMDFPNTFKREEGRSIPKEWLEGRLPEIEFRHVSFKYEPEGEDVLKDISFTIHPGERLALVGHNGAGKTTLVKLLCGFYRPSDGEILIGGISIEDFNLNEYHDLLATIFQEIIVFPTSIASNISGRIESETDMAKVRSCIERADLWKDVEKLEKRELTSLTQTFDESGIQLSGGQMQKMMLARCIYKDAPILILDEPTAALDPLAESRMYEEYDRASKGKSTLFISHRLASTKFCDRILFIEHGMIAEEGTHDESIQKNGKYAEVFDIQSKYYKEGGEEHEKEEC